MNVFHTPETTMTPEEAEAIVRRHLERVPEMPSGPSVADVAEVLRLRPEEVAKLLAEVRLEGRKQPKRRVSRRERKVWLLSGALAVVVGSAAVFGMHATRTGPFRPHSLLNYNAIPGEPYEVFVDGKDLGVIRYSGPKGEEANALPTQVERLLKEQRWQFQPVRSQPDSVIDETRRAVQEGRWSSAPGIEMSSVEVREGGSGTAMRWARTTAPVYNGDDALVAEAVSKERARLVNEAVKVAMKGIPVPPPKP